MENKNDFKAIVEAAGGKIPLGDMMTLYMSEIEAALDDALVASESNSELGMAVHLGVARTAAKNLREVITVAINQ